MGKTRTTLLDHLNTLGFEMITTQSLLNLNEKEQLGFSEKYLASFLHNSTGENNSRYRICTRKIENDMYQIYHN
jgi:hypothetical protein